MKLKKFTEEDKSKFIEQHPQAEPKLWAIIDEDLPGTGVIGFYDTAEEALKAKEDLELSESIHDLFWEWVMTTANDLEAEPSRVILAVKRSII